MKQVLLFAGVLLLAGPQMGAPGTAANTVGENPLFGADETKKPTKATVADSSASDNPPVAVVDQAPETYDSTESAEYHHRARATLLIEQSSLGGLARFKLGAVDGHFLGERNKEESVPEGYGAWASSPRVVFANSTPYGTETREGYPQSGYIGRWHNGSRDGVGLMWWPDGRVYAGNWKNNHFDGPGLLLRPDGVRYAGEWQRGQQEGHGVQWGDSSFYIGTWKNGMADGHGVHVDGELTRSSFVGDWVGGSRTGNGTHIDWMLGKHFDGAWVANRPHGAGVTTFTERDGSIYVGNFQHGTQDGVGAVCEPSGGPSGATKDQIILGRWENGVAQVHLKDEPKQWIADGGNSVLVRAMEIYAGSLSSRMSGLYAYTNAFGKGVTRWGVADSEANPKNVHMPDFVPGATSVTSEEITAALTSSL